MDSAYTAIELTESGLAFEGRGQIRILGTTDNEVTALIKIYDALTPTAGKVVMQLMIEGESWLPAVTVRCNVGCYVEVVSGTVLGIYVFRK